MFAMLKQMFTALTVLFTAFESQAKAINHLSTWAEESAGAFADEARLVRQDKLNNLLKHLHKSETELAEVTSQPVVKPVKAA